MNTYEDDLGAISLKDLIEMGSGPKRPVVKAPQDQLDALDWDALVLLQPKLNDFLEMCTILGRAKKTPQKRDYLWYTLLRSQLESLVGWHAESDDPVVRSQKAYQIAYVRCHDALMGYTG